MTAEAPPRDPPADGMAPAGWAALGDLAAGVPAAAAIAAGWPRARRVQEADRCADIIASGADILRASGVTAAQAEVTPGQVREAVITGPPGRGGVRWDPLASRRAAVRGTPQIRDAAAVQRPGSGGNCRCLLYSAVAGG
jgi:hypothetical protein